MVNQHGKQLTLKDIWGIGVWIQPFPNSRYQARPERSAMALGIPTARVDNLSSSLRRLPRELSEMIFGYCQDSPLCRFLLALYRSRLYRSLIDVESVGQELPLTSIQSWDRVKGLVIGPSQSSRVRICLDSLGIRKLEPFDDHDTSTPGRDGGDSWYAVEEIDDLRGVQVEIKVVGCVQSFPPTRTKLTATGSIPAYKGCASSSTLGHAESASPAILLVRSRPYTKASALCQPGRNNRAYRVLLERRFAMDPSSPSSF